MEFIPFNILTPYQDEAVAEALLSVHRGGQYILGERLDAFEKEYAHFTGVRHCVGVGSGYDALLLSLKAIGLLPGDEVIVPANTYVATWLAVSNAGGVPVPVEPDQRTCNLDPTRIAERITSRTKAIIPVHLFGNPCDMHTIMGVARTYGLKVIEDNAQGHGARLVEDGTHGAQLTGSFGEVNATSFYPTKNLGALGDGGAITTNDEEIAARIRRLRNYGFSSKNVCDEVGVNSRLDELQAAVLSVKLGQLYQRNNRRRTIADAYTEALYGVGDLQLPVTTAGGEHVYHLYVVRTRSRNALAGHLQKNNIQTAIHYPVPPHLQKAYGHLNYKHGSFPITETMAATMLSLPFWPDMNEQQIARVVESVRSFY